MPPLGLTVRALHLLREIAAGRDRIYATDARPPGAAALMQRGYMVRVGMERAEITPTGRAFLDGVAFGEGTMAATFAKAKV